MPDDKIVPLTQAVQYGDWRIRDAKSTNTKDIELGLGASWVKAGGLRAKKQTVPITHPKNKWQQGGLDLAAISGGGSPSGVYAVAV